MNQLPGVDFSFAGSAALDQYLLSGGSGFLNYFPAYKSNTYPNRGWEKQAVDL